MLGDTQILFTAWYDDKNMDNMHFMKLIIDGKVFKILAKLWNHSLPGKNVKMNFYI